MNFISKTAIRYAAAFMIGVILSNTTKAYSSAPWEQAHKLVAFDRIKGDLFGTSVAIDGNTAIIGEIGCDINGDCSGAAYIFDVSSGEQLLKFVASFENGVGNFGASVGISGHLAVVGAPLDYENGSRSGSAFIFDVSTGEQLFKLLASDGVKDDLFGTSVAISGNLVVIGEDQRNSNGAAYVYDATTGQEIFKLLASDGSPVDDFGISVSISGNFAIVGAMLDDGVGFNSGSAYIFDLTTGNEVFKLVANDGAESDIFGNSVSIDGNLAVIGADQDNNKIGSAYIFDVTTGKQLFKLIPSDGAVQDLFGKSVAISGNNVVIGSYHDDDNGTDSGSAYVFDAITGKQLSKLLSSDGVSGDNFGDSVAISGLQALIGAYLDDDLGIDTGSAYVFQQRTTNLLDISPLPLISGQDGIFTITRGVPNEQSWVIYSLVGLQQTFIRELNVFVDLKNPKIAFGPGLTDENGNIQVVRRMPSVMNSITIWFQAVQHRSVTNFIATQILP